MRKQHGTRSLWKRNLRILLLGACLLAIPMTVFAADGASREGAWDGSVDISWYTESGEDPSKVEDFYIDTPAQLAGLAYIVNGRLDMEVFPLAYQENTEGTGLYKRTEGKDAAGNPRTFYVLSADKDGKTNGDTDVDIEKTLQAKIDGRDAMIDGTEEDGTTASGLTAKDFWVEKPVYIQLTGGGGGNTWDQIYTGYQKYDFIGQTVHIRADLDMGGTFSSNDWSGPNWTPIGGKYPMDPVTAEGFAKNDIVTIDASFNGTLDGGGHSIHHLYCDRTTNKGFEYSQGVALIGQIGELYDNKDRGYGHEKTAEKAPEGWVPTVRNLSVGSGDPKLDAAAKGYIYGRRMVGGVLGLVGAIPAGILVENCANYATLESTDSKGIGGIVGSGWGRGVGTIRNCYNRGNVTATYAESPAGGISGANSMNIYNCYNTGQISNKAGSGSDVRASGIGRHDSSTYIVDNCYSLEGSFQDTSNDGYWIGTSTTVIANVYVRGNASGEKGAGLKEDAFLEEINADAGQIFVKDTAGINQGYPVLFWQDPEYASKGACTVTAADETVSGKIAVHIPRIKTGGSYEAETTLEPGQSMTVPYGTVVTLGNEAVLPNVLQNYMAGGKKLRANYYTVTADAVLGGDFIRLAQGTIHFADNKTSHLGVVKTGAALVNLDGSDQIMKVSDYPVRDGDTVFQNDILSYKAVLKKGSAPKEKKLEYDGTFNYTFTYPEGTLPEISSKDNLVNTFRTRHTVSAAIGGGEGESAGTLQLEATAGTREKNWTGLADTSWYDQSQAKTSYTLKTPAQLAGLAVLVNGGESFKGVTVKLGKSISLANPDGTGEPRYWIPIGNSGAHAFEGSFDGAGYSVTGMKVNSSGGTAGLFGYCKKAVIKNLTVSGTSSSIGMTGGIAANVSGGSISGCLNNVKVDSTGQKAGGIVAELKDKAKVTSCRNKGKISGNAQVGGIAGSTDASGITISKCANYAAVTGTTAGSSSATGGICGYLGGTASLCANYGTVQGANVYIGGIAGHTWANTKVNNDASSTIRNSFNWGAVKNTNGGSAPAAGGLVGYAQYIIMDNCYSTGSVSLSTSSDRPHQGQLIGYFYKSIYNSVKNTYYKGSGRTIVCRDTENSARDGLDISKQGVKLKYVSIAKKSAKKMKSAAFARQLNKRAKKSFVQVKGSYVQLVWATKVKEYKVTFTGAYKKTVRTWYNGAVELPKAPNGYTYSFTDAKTGKSWSGLNIKKNVKVKVKKTRIKTSYVRFLRDGKEVAKLPFAPADLYLKTAAPDPEAVAHKEGYIASWEETGYWDPARTEGLGTADLVVNAVYAQNQISFDRVRDTDGNMRAEAEITPQMAAENSYYFLPPEARGTVTVKSGATATIDGSNGPFTNLRIAVEQGAVLTLHNIDMSTDPAELTAPETAAGALELRGGADRAQAAVVLLSGYSNIYGNNDGFNLKADGTRDTDTKYPAILVSGYGIIDQASSVSDTLHICAYKDNPEINLPDDATLEIAGGTLEVYKLERLGAQGGMIYGTDYDYDTRAARGDQQGDLTVSGGTLIAVSDTNNVFAFCVDHYSQSGGQVLCYATEAETDSSMIDKGGSGLDRAVYATSMEITGGSLRAASRTHKDNDTDEVHNYENGDAIRFGPDTGNLLTENFFLYTIDTSSWKGSVHTVTADGRTIYQGGGNNVGYVFDTGDSFLTKLSETDQHIYLWIPREGKTHTIAVDGKTIARNVAEEDKPKETNKLPDMFSKQHLRCGSIRGQTEGSRYKL